MPPDREAIERFVDEHGHPPWIVCGDEEYGCLLDEEEGA